MTGAAGSQSPRWTDVPRIEVPRMLVMLDLHPDRCGGSASLIEGLIGTQLLGRVKHARKAKRIPAPPEGAAVVADCPCAVRTGLRIERLVDIEAREWRRGWRIRHSPACRHCGMVYWVFVELIPPVDTP